MTEYEVDKKTYLIIAGALVYVVFPIDIIPDFILGVGFLDDAFVGVCSETTLRRNRQIQAV